MDKITLEEITNIDNHVDTHLEVHIDYANLRKIYHELNELDLSSLNFEEGSKIVGEILKIKSILDSLEEEIIDEDEEKRRELDQEYYKYLDELSLREEIIDEDDKEDKYSLSSSQIDKCNEYKIIYIGEFYYKIDCIYKYLKTKGKHDFDYVVTELLNLINNLELEMEMEIANSQSNLVINISSNQCKELIDGLNGVIDIITSIQDEYMGCEGEDFSEFMDSYDINEILKKLKELTSQGISEKNNKIYNENRRKKRKSISKREAKNKKYFELKKQELSNTEIAKEMGISNQAVGQFFKRHEK